MYSQDSLPMLWRIRQYIKHQFYRRHTKGRHIHSPYSFEFVHEVIFNASKGEVPAEIRNLHRELHMDSTLIPAAGPGAPSSVDDAPYRSVGSFVKSSSVSLKYGALLYRISRWFRPGVILELGTGLGISTLYLCAGSPDTPLHTIEANRDRADFSEGLFKRSGMPTVQVHVGEMEEVLETLTDAVQGRILAFVDGNHRYDATIGYLRWILGQAGEEAVVVMDDITWSKEMMRAWQEIISWPEVRMSIDLFHMGMLLLRKDLQKADLKIKF